MLRRKEKEEQIQLLHPEGKHGATILKRRYDVIRDVILKIIGPEDEVSFMELTERAPTHLTHFDGKNTWYITALKLDLEARGVLERFQKDGRQYLRRTGREAEM